MAGLVVLGVLTVIAGVLSGHSTVDYVLGRDAQEAVLSWAAEIDTKLDKSDAPRHVLDKDIQILDASPFQQNLTSISGKPAGLPANQGFSRGGFGLVEVLDRMTGGWALGHSRQPKDDFVSKLDGFAVLDPNETPIATAGNLSADKLATLLTQDKVREALTTSTRENAVDVASTDEAGDTRVAFGPVTQDGKIARIYAFSLDQSAAALTNVALTVATLMASLFIVLGFSVPAAIASRRIRERWLAEDQIRHLALHDSLTGLPNRLQFHQHLDRAVARAKRHGQLMDDFGTGYSSLSYLTRFPVKKIKIDRSFIDTLGTSPQTSAIVSSIVGLGQSLHVTITAEGVETEGQAAMLKKWGCDQVQGFYYGKPEADVPESTETKQDRPLVA